MTDENELLREVSGAIFQRGLVQRDPTGRLQPDLELWARVEEAGLVSLLLPEASGGGGGTIAQMAVVLEEAGRWGAAVPIAEAGLLGARLLVAAGIAAPEGPWTSSPRSTLTAERRATRWELTGSLDRVGFGAGSFSTIALCRGPTGPAVAVLSPDAGQWTAHRNLADEPRDTLRLNRSTGADVHPVDVDLGEELRLLGLLGRACLMVGALDRAVELALAHVQAREQFGRPLSRFQSVQHLAARMASSARAASAAVEGAVGAVGMHSPAVVAAKTEANRAAREVARAAHQLLGAIGFTDEHPLHVATTRLWAWSQEDGVDGALQDELGTLVAARGSVWKAIADDRRAP